MPMSCRAIRGIVTKVSFAHNPSRASPAPQSGTSPRHPSQGLSPWT